MVPFCSKGATCKNCGKAHCKTYQNFSYATAHNKLCLQHSFVFFQRMTLETKRYIFTECMVHLSQIWCIFTDMVHLSQPCSLTTAISTFTHIVQMLIGCIWKKQPRNPQLYFTLRNRTDASGQWSWSAKSAEFNKCRITDSNKRSFEAK